MLQINAICGRNFQPDFVLSMRKVFFLLIDGLSDNSYLDGCENGLDYKTPMQMAKTPTLDALASSGALCGIMDPVAPGIACGSDTAHLSIFGYDPYTYRIFLTSILEYIKVEGHLNPLAPVLILPRAILHSR